MRPISWTFRGLAKGALSATFSFLEVGRRERGSFCKKGASSSFGVSSQDGGYRDVDNAVLSVDRRRWRRDGTTPSAAAASFRSRWRGEQAS
mmetsp:Transcript_2418/g.9257  ORF Transcript_2418/g.9257 Transcript_2418/m.9257 type:complete len:91 (+) Transcript_2418:219-491(+)